MTQHSPAPWKIEHHRNSPHWAMTRIVSAEGHSVAQLSVGPWTTEYAQSNLALIAAAPDLLAALELILTPSPHYAATKAHRDLIAEARAKGLDAIAKARGE